MRSRLLSLICLIFIFGVQNSYAQFPAPYCPVSYTQNIEPITNVTFSNINNTTNAALNGSPAHEDFTSMVANVTMGQTYTISVQGNTGGSWTNHFKVWIDWDRNGVFNNTNEEFVIGSILNSTGTDGQTASTTITIPNNITAGQTRLRVVKKFSTQPTACNTDGWGQAEDYTINIIPFTNCSGTPNGGNATSSITNILCPGGSFTLSLNNSTLEGGITHQWQSSTDNVNFTNIQGATGYTHTLTQAASLVYYRAIVKCNNSGDSSFSTSVAVTNGSGPTYASLPFFEGFENVWMNTCNTREIPNNSWRNTPGSGNNSWRRNDDGSSASWSSVNTGSYSPASSQGAFSARFHSSSSSGSQPGTFDLHVNANTPSVNKRVKFDYINTSGNDSLAVYFSTNGTNFNRLGGFKTTTGWQTVSLEFASSTNTIIRFMAYGDNGTTDIGIDNLRVSDFDNCAGVPTGGTVSSNANNLCLTTPFTLTATGFTEAAGITYQWEKADSIISGTGYTAFAPIAGATSTIFTTTQAVTTKYRLKVTCSFTGDVGYSDTVVVKSPPILGGNYVIDKNAPASELWPSPGKNTFKSFNSAIVAMQCGIMDHVNFTVATGSGPYNEHVVFNGVVPGASANRKITFYGNGEILTLAPSATQKAVIKFTGAKHIRIDSLVINVTSTSSGMGVMLTNNSDTNVISRSTINLPLNSSSANFAGIVINDSSSNPISTSGKALSDSNTFRNNTINGGYYGIAIAASDLNASGFNNIEGNNIKDFHKFGIYLIGTYNSTITKNKISRPTRSTVDQFIGIMVDSKSGAGNLSNEFTKNRIFNPFGGNKTASQSFTGISFDGINAVAREHFINNNAIYYINGTGQQTGISVVNSDGLWFLHNTIVLDSTSPSSQYSRGLYHSSSSPTLNIFWNNIVKVTRAGTGQKHAIYYNTANSTLNSDFNDLVVSGPNAFVGYYGGNRSTLAQWIAATSNIPNDEHSKDLEPIFVDINNGNGNPQNAAVDNRGTFVGIMDDIEGNPRNMGSYDDPSSGPRPDMGAWEFVPPPCTPPVLAGTVKIEKTSDCWNTPIHLSLIGNTFGGSQEYQWQVLQNGSFVNFGTPNLFPDTTFLQDTSFYLRAAVTCGNITAYSDTVFNNVSQPLYAGTYTIDSSAATNYGKGSGNFRNFTDAIASMGCGITGPIVFSVQSFTPSGSNLPGYYNEQIKLKAISNASPTNTITFKGNNNTIRWGSVVTQERAVIKMDSARHYIIDSLNIMAMGGNFGYGIHLLNDADSNIVRNSRIIIDTSTISKNQNFVGVVISSNLFNPIAAGKTNVDANWFDNNTIFGGYYSITSIGGNNAADFINDNKFTNNTFTEFFNTGLYILGNNNTLVEGNLFTRPTRTDFTSTTGIYVVNANSTGLKISKNRFTKLFTGNPTSPMPFYGIYFNNVDGSANSVVNNIFYELDGNGIQYPLYNNSSDNVDYYHNTISLDDTTTLGANNTAGFYQVGTASGINFMNNLIYITRNTTGNKYGLYFGSAQSGINSDYNDIYVSGGDKAYTGFYNGNKKTLADFQLASNTDQNSLDLDPLFDKSLGYPDAYKPALYPLDNKGTPVGVTTDIIGATRSTTTPDIGAFEFTAPACPGTIVAGTASVTPSSGLCLEQPITLNVTGHSPLGMIAFQWEASATGTPGTFVPLSGIQYKPEYDTVSAISAYYRAAVICGNSTVYTNVVHLALNPILAGGTYTIDSSAAAGDLWPLPGKTHFLSFTDAVTALQCGITDKVTFNVKHFVSPASGSASNIYREQIRIGYIPGTSSTKTITFQADPSNTNPVVLTYLSTSGTSNYTLKIDSTTYLTFKNLTLASEDTALGRVIEIAGTSAFDSILNCNINMPLTVMGSNSNALAGIFSFAFRGSNIVIANNTINNGATGIYFSGVNGLTPTTNISITGNTFNNTTGYGIFAQFHSFGKINSNTFNINGPLSVNSYGIYTNNFDSSYQINKNIISIGNSLAGSTYGMYISNSRTNDMSPGSIIGNKITIANNNSSVVNGMFLNSLTAHMVWNNVIAVKTSGPSAYGLYAQNSGKGTYYNNTVQNSSDALSPNNYAGYFNNSNATDIVLRNNIFSSIANTVTNNKALFVYNTEAINSNYNMLYSSGTHLMVRSRPSAVNYATLKDIKAGAFTERYSIAEVKPAFISETDLRPDLNKDSVWAMHGRGVQVGFGINNVDIDGKYRPDSTIYGVPDLGAYEFYPNVPPVPLTGVPAVPAINSEQYFMFGTDSVMRFSWGSAVPPSVNVQRYSGVAPPGLPNTYDSMYFYNQVNVPNPLGSYNFELKQFFVPSWKGTIENLTTVGLGRTNKDAAWVIVPTSTNKLKENAILSNTQLDYADKFTGLVNPFIPPIIPDQDSSNTGRRFWVAYPINQLNGGSTQQMVLYLSAREQSANVTVRINGTNWVRSYFVPAGTVTVTEYLPKTGPDNAFIQTPGLSNRGIYIESDEPITAYTHTIGSASSGGTTLLPVGVWAYEYSMLCITQDYGASSYSYFYVIADNDNTKVQITPTVPVQNMGMAVNVPTVVTLNKGEWYQVIASSQTQELSGSYVKSIPNENGDCFPIAMFSGSSRTAINIGSCGSGGDFIMQQNFPYSAWGTRYLTAPTSRSSTANQFETNIYRVLVKDPTTVVTRTSNTGTVTLTGLTPQNYYQFSTNKPEFIKSDKPIMVAQFEGGSCSGDVGDPEMIYISPIDQGIKDIGFYRNTEQSIQVNYLTLIIPSAGVNTLELKDDGVSQNWDVNMDHPGLAGYKIMIKRWSPAAKKQVTVTSDSAFTAITYGMGSVESYGYNAGTLVKTLVPRSSITIPSNPDSLPYSSFTCAGTPFLFNVYIPLKPTSLTWQFSKVPGLSITTDSIQYNPEPIDSVYQNNRWYYIFTVQQTFISNQSAILSLPVTFTHPDIESCDNTFTSQIHVQVTPKPDPDFNVNFGGCLYDTAYFSALSTTSLGLNIEKFKWDLLDNDSSTNKDTLKLFTTPGVKNIHLNILTAEGCYGDTIKPVMVNPLPEINMVNDVVEVCSGAPGTLDILNPEAGTVYEWYDAAVGGNLIYTGNSYTVQSLTSDVALYIQATSAEGCNSSGRKKVELKVLVPTPPVISMVQDVENVCLNGNATFTINSVEPNTSYTWYDNAGMTGTPVFVGPAYTINNVTASTPTRYYILAERTSGCTASNTHMVELVIGAPPVIIVDNSQLEICAGSSATINIINPDPNTAYNWYSAPGGGGTPLGTGISYTTGPLSSSTNLYIIGVGNNCTSEERQVSIFVTDIPTVSLVQTDLEDCEGNTVNVQVQNPGTGLTYTWSGPGVPAGYTGNSLAVTQSGSYSVTSSTANPVCTSNPAAATVTLYSKLATPVVKWDENNQSPVAINFTWQSIAGAVSYEVATNAAGPFTNIGNNTSYSVTNVLPASCSTLYVRAVGKLACQISDAGSDDGCALDDKIYIPNSFTPNNDGKNDTWFVDGSIIKNVKLSIFNQWGQKVFEATGAPQSVKWDGRYKGDYLPTGVYVFVMKLELKDNTVVDKKGSINLIR